MGRVSDMTSRIRLLLAVSTTACTVACINVGLGGEGSPQAQYRLDDLSPKVQPRSTPIDRRLLLSTTPFESIGDTHSMAYSRAGQQREFYQFASWTDRPSTRIVQLLSERIEARGMFESVSRLGGGIGGGLILNVGVNEFVHDVGTGTARVEVTAELIERRYPGPRRNLGLHRHRWPQRMPRPQLLR